MKRAVLPCLMLFYGFVFSVWGNGAEETIAEKVKVVNVVVPVRVFAAGKPVSDLKKEDFTILENNRLQSINGFYMESKKIAMSADAVSRESQTPPSRYFVLAFRVHDFNDALRQGLVYTFEKILRPQDRLLVFMNDFSKPYDDLADKENILLEVEQNLQDQCHILRNAMSAKLKELDEWVKKIKLGWEDKAMMWASPSAFQRDFLQKYLELLRDYKSRFLTQSIDKYYLFSKYLEKIGGEKWVISFCQKEMLPRVSDTAEVMRYLEEQIAKSEASTWDHGMGVTLTQMQRDLEIETSTGVEFPIDDVSKLFYKVNATFHSILIDTQFDSRSPDLEFKAISGGMERSLRVLSEKTGGTAVSSTDVRSSLAKLAEKEDSYYMLTYVPRSAIVGKIKVNVARKGCTVVYDDNQRADYIDKYLEKMAGAKSVVKIEGLSLENKRLSLTLSGYTLAKLKDEIAGFIGVHIRLKNEQKKDVYNGNKMYKAGSPSFGLSLDFPDLEPGRYDVVVDVIDQIGSQLYTDFIQPLVQ